MNQLLPCFSTLAKSIVVGGIYQHYKGMHYEIIGIARHSESLEELVVYRALYGKNDLWVRPLQMFLDEIVFEDKLLSRFRLVQQDEIGKSVLI